MWVQDVDLEMKVPEVHSFLVLEVLVPMES